MNKVIFPLLFLVCCGTGFLFSQTRNSSFTLEDAWERMRESNRDLKEMELAWKQAGRTAEAPDQWIPSIGAGASLNRSSPFISTLTMPGEDKKEEGEYWSVRGSVDMQLRITPGLSVAEEIEELKADMAGLAMEEEASSLKYDLTVLFYQILAGDKRITLRQDSLTLAENRLSQTEQQYRQGLKSDLDLLSARISAAEDLPALQKEKAEQEKRYIILRSYLGLDEDADVSLDPPAEEQPTLPGPDDLTTHLSSGRDLVLLEKKIRLAQLTCRLSRKGINGPTLGMSLGWSSSVSPAFDADSWTGDQWRDSLGLGFSVSVPLDGHIKGSADQLNLLETEEAIISARGALEEARRNRWDEIRSLTLDLELSRSNIQLNEWNVTLLEQSYRKIEESYNSGKASLSDQEESRQELKEAVLDLEDEKLNLKIQTVEMLYLLNLL